MLTNKCLNKTAPEYLRSLVNSEKQKDTSLQSEIKYRKVITG